MTTDLLVDDGADETARNAPAALRGEEVGVSKLCELLLQVRLATRDNVRELVVDEQEDERDGFDRLNEEEAEGRERRLLGGVGSSVVTGTARIGDVGKEVLFAVGRQQSAAALERSRDALPARDLLLDECPQGNQVALDRAQNRLWHVGHLLCRSRARDGDLLTPNWSQQASEVESESLVATREDNLGVRSCARRGAS